MSRIDKFAGLQEFLAVAELGNFRAAAARLRVSPSAVSQAVKALEARLGVPLFIRTTRHVGFTEAGSILWERLNAPAAEITELLDDLGALGGTPAGLLRLTVPRIAVELAIARMLPEFLRLYPRIKVELDVNDASIDLASSGYDAGIRIGHFIEQDMIAVRLTPPFRWCVLGSPSHFAANGRPESPEDLIRHRCIGYRFPTAKSVYRWQFQRDGQSFSIDVADDVIVNDHLTMIALAREGGGLVFTADLVAADEIRSGRLERVLDSHCIETPGLHLYFPSRNQAQPKLRAFIDFIVKALRRQFQPTEGCELVATYDLLTENVP